MSDAAPVGLGLRAQKGGAVAVAIALRGGVPDPLLSTFLATHDAEDRLSLEPYRIAHERRAAPEEAAAAVAEGRKRQDTLADVNVRGLLAGLGNAPIAAGLLVNRAGWVTDLLAYSLEWPDHVPVAEGLAVREALRFGLGQNDVATIELDEKALSELAIEALGQTRQAIDNRIKQLGIVAGKPWHKEQKLACLAAWVAAARR